MELLILSTMVAVLYLADFWRRRRIRLERERRRRIYLAKDAARHLDAYAQKLYTEDYNRANRNIVSLPYFIEYRKYKKAMEGNGYVS